VEQVGAEPPGRDLDRELAVGGRDDPDVDPEQLVGADPLDLADCRARRSLGWIESGSSPISSRNRVPPSATSNLPARCSVAPVNAPRTWPNSSLSAIDSGNAAQLM